MSPLRSVRQPVLVWTGWLIVLLVGVVIGGTALVMVASWWGVIVTP